MDDETQKRFRLMKNLAGKLEVPLEKSDYAVGSEECGATAELLDGSLRTKIYPCDSGLVMIEGTRLPGIEIEVIDRNNQNTTSAMGPKGGVYAIHTYFPEGEQKVLTTTPGVIYIDSEGRFLDARGDRLTQKRDE